MPASEISREQEYVAGLYERVDALREQASARLAQALREDGGTAQSRLERDAAIARYAGQLARLDAAESGLCFGRLDLRSGECLGRGPGGPGTGKTAVALHRAAYLLYTHRHLAQRGVLVVGPSATFLGYISQVLPGLGETNVLLHTVGELFPGVVADRVESRLAEEVKGRATMADVLAAAVRDRQGTGPAEIEFADETLHLDAEVVREAADRQLPHPSRDHGGHRSPPGRDRPRTAAAAAKSEGRLAVIVPDTLVAELGDVVSRAVPGVSFGESPDLTSPVVVLGARQAKGLEFDSVLIADPAAILAGSSCGRNDLYVAMTRTTQRLGVLHPGRPPAELATLRVRRLPGGSSPK